MDEKNYRTKEYHKLVCIESTKEVCSYYRKNALDLGEDMVAALFTAIAFALYFYIKDGANIDWLGILLSFLVGVVGVLLFRFLIAVWNVPAKLYRVKEIAAGRIDWSNINFTPIPYSILGFSGWGLNVENKKKIEFNKLRVRIEIKQMSVNQKKTLDDKGRSLQYIDSSAGKFYEKISQCWKGCPPIERGKDMNFVFTTKLQKTPVLIYEFCTFPDKDIPWPFNLDSLTPPEVVVECEIQGNIEIGEENWGLPSMKKYFQVMSNGEILDYKN